MTHHKDEKTAAYFDARARQWSLGRYRRVLDLLAEHMKEDARLIDIGCGNGNILQNIGQNTPIRHLTGLDPSAHNLSLANARVQCQTIVGSILDPAIISAYQRQFDFAIMGDVLHHLVGRSRAASRALAQQALANAIDLIKENGLLLVVEPHFRPAALVLAGFYIKLAVTTVTTSRLELLGKKWANIGAPVVAYYDPAALQAMVAQIKKAQLVELSATPLKKIGFGMQHGRITLAAQRCD